MTEQYRKATVSEDGGSIEVYSGAKRYVIALGFSVWEWIRLMKAGDNLPKVARKAPLHARIHV